MCKPLLKPGHLWKWSVTTEPAKVLKEDGFGCSHLVIHAVIFFGFLSLSHYLLCRLTESTQKVKSYMFLSLSTVNTVSKRTAVHFSMKKENGLNPGVTYSDGKWSSEWNALWLVVRMVSGDWCISQCRPEHHYIRHMTLKIASAQDVETPATTNNPS